MQTGRGGLKRLCADDVLLLRDPTTAAARSALLSAPTKPLRGLDHPPSPTMTRK
jgi:hypothetical protein